MLSITALRAGFDKSAERPRALARGGPSWWTGSTGRNFCAVRGGRGPRARARRRVLGSFRKRFSWDTGPRRSCGSRAGPKELARRGCPSWTSGGGGQWPFRELGRGPGSDGAVTAPPAKCPREATALLARGRSPRKPARRARSQGVLVLAQGAPFGTRSPTSCFDPRQGAWPSLLVAPNKEAQAPCEVYRSVPWRALQRLDDAGPLRPLERAVRSDGGVRRLSRGRDLGKLRDRRLPRGTEQVPNRTLRAFLASGALSHPSHTRPSSVGIPPGSRSTTSVFDPRRHGFRFRTHHDPPSVCSYPAVREACGRL
jgi:hypothetical protein